MRELKNHLESHPTYLILTLIIAILALIFLFIDLNDHMKWSFI